MAIGRLCVLLSVLVGLLVGVGLFTFHFAQGPAYLGNDPNACANCHIMRDHLDSWQKSSHHARAVCNDCHAPQSLLPKLITKADNGWNHSTKFTLQTYGDPIRIRTVNAEKLQENCLRCHQEMVGEIGSLSAHANIGETYCIRCHAGAGHGPRR
ncbi:MAG: cytochrome c nitrite reductase small subunit [Acidobacteria bacterium]|nr:cytochrome c nitrite reductase small subunit [Acidobacteriota bacterium]